MMKMIVLDFNSMTKINNMFETVSFHVVKPCNMGCKFCYATFEDFNVVNQLNYDDACTILYKLHRAGVEKVTFAGGEPMLWKHLQDAIVFAKGLGMTTSIITNGAMIKEQWLIDMQKHLDWIGLSVDSINYNTNKQIGRVHKGMPLDYYMLVSIIHKYNYKLKINTVVNAYNQYENLNHFINFANPLRWKVFQALRIEGQNDAQWDEVKVTDISFELYLKAHRNQKSLVPEDNEAMTGSYLLVDPLGRFFENSKGTHTYSDPVQNNTVEHCLSQINLDREMFVKRGGLYEW